MIEIGSALRSRSFVVLATFDFLMWKVEFYIHILCTF